MIIFRNIVFAFVGLAVVSAFLSLTSLFEPGPWLAVLILGAALAAALYYLIHASR